MCQIGRKWQRKIWLTCYGLSVYYWYYYCTVAEICRKITRGGGVGVSLIKPSNCFRRLEKISFTVHFWHKSFILHDVKLGRVIQQQFWMKECDIGGQNILWPLIHIFFGGVRTPQPPWSAPLLLRNYCYYYDVLLLFVQPSFADITPGSAHGFRWF